MKIVDGVHLHIIKTQQFKTNSIKIRFSSLYDEKKLAKRLMVAQMLDTANAVYPSNKLFRQALSERFGASFVSQVGSKGSIHYVDIDVSFLRDRFVGENTFLLKEMITFISDCLFKPLISVEQYSSKTFDLEYQTVKQYFEAEKEDPFSYSDREMHKLLFFSSILAEPQYASLALLEKENSYTSYQEFRRMLSEDSIDIFFVGEADEYELLESFSNFDLQPREEVAPLSLQLPHSNLIKEKIESTYNNQSILSLGFISPIQYQDVSYPSLLVCNGLFGGFAHSFLFAEVREKLGLAYTINSHVDAFTGTLRVDAGVDAGNRQKVLAEVIKSLRKIRHGRFSKKQLDQTKLMLIHNAKMAQDNPFLQMERLYNRHYFSTSLTTIDEWIDAIKNVTREDIQKTSKHLSLSAVYFLEGNE